MMLKKKILTPVVFLLIASVLLIPVFASTPDQGTEAVIPEGFVPLRDTPDNTWFTKETDVYLASLTKRENGDYHLMYTFRDSQNKPVYEKTITPSELGKVEYYIRETRAGRIPSGTTQTIIPDTNQSQD